MMRAIYKLVAAVACAASAWGQGGCKPSVKEDAALLIAAVEKMRATPDEGKGSLVSTLEAVPCTAPAVCDAKKDCVAYARAAVTGHTFKVEVERGLADVKSGKLRADDPAAQALFQKLDESAKAIKEAEAALIRCDEKVLQLKR